MEQNLPSPRDCGEDEDDENSDSGVVTTIVRHQRSSTTKGGGSNNVHHLPSSTRLARNFAEKQRRTKLNTYIDELRSLVPMVSSSVAARSGKKVDKTSILRLSATFLRMHQILYGKRAQFPSLPPELKDFNWSKFILDDMNGILLLVTSAGKIVFISHTIDKILGHNQTELFGQSLYSFTCPEDHEELKRNLSPDLDPNSLLAITGHTNSSLSELSGDEGDDASTSGSCNSNQSSPSFGSGSSYVHVTERQRRSFYLRLRQKGCSRSEKPQYELVHVLGHLRITRRQEDPVVTRRSRKTRELAVGSNDIVLVAVIRPFKERRVTELSLLEANREEYITRHLKDGRIIYCDHRISFVSGYLSNEISGLSGFMFMHKDDMKWTMIALRQMYIRNESYGNSCYRLLDKTGKFFYIRTHGYLEFDPNESYADDYFPSFICINTLISAEEGEAAIRSMKARFTPLIENKVEPGILAIAEGSSDKYSHRSSSTDSDSPLPAENAVSDPDELRTLIKSLISNIPNSSNKPASPSIASEEPQYLKLHWAAKSMPPASVHTANLVNNNKSIKNDPKEEVINVIKKCPPPSQVQNRPSVLRGPIRSLSKSTSCERVGVVVTSKRSHEDDQQNSELSDKKPRSSYDASCLGSNGSLCTLSPPSSSVSSYSHVDALSPVDTVTSPEDMTPKSTYLNLDIRDGLEIRRIIEAPSFIDEEQAQAPIHTSELFEDLAWDDGSSLNISADDLASSSTEKSLRSPFEEGLEGASYPPHSHEEFRSSLKQLKSTQPTSQGLLQSMLPDRSMQPYS